MPRLLVVHRERSNLTIYWSIYLTLILFVIGFAAWIIFNFHLFIAGIHVHHWPLGILNIFLAFASFFISSATFTLKFHSPVGSPQQYNVVFNYAVTPFITGLVWLITGLILVATDWQDLSTFISNPSQFNWGA